MIKYAQLSENLGVQFVGIAINRFSAKIFFLFIYYIYLIKVSFYFHRKKIQGTL